MLERGGPSNPFYGGATMSKVTRNFFADKGLISEETEKLKGLAVNCPSLFGALAGTLEDDIGDLVPPARLTFSIKAGKLRASLIPEKAKQGVFMDVTDLAQPFKSVEDCLNSGQFDVANWDEKEKTPRRAF